MTFFIKTENHKKYLTSKNVNKILTRLNNFVKRQETQENVSLFFESLGKEIKILEIGEKEIIFNESFSLNKIERKEFLLEDLKFNEKINLRKEIDLLKENFL